MKFNENLRMFRKSINNLTLLDVAKETGLSVSFLSDMERGQTRPSIETIQKLAMFYKVSVDDLLGDEKTNELYQSDRLPETLKELTKEMEFEPDILDLMLIAEQRSKNQPETKEDWKKYYYSLKALLGR